MTPRRAGWARGRRGVTLTELLIVLSIAAALAMIAVPRARSVIDRGSASSATAEVGAAIESARFAAMQRGRRATVRLRGDSVIAVVDTGPPWVAATGQMLVLRVANTRRGYGVTLNVPNDVDSIVYDPRGFANPRKPAGTKYVLTRNAARDSVCIGELGMIMPRGCRL
jgi:prepilin-type N-terminal cleavage/methylation domain-containing protein